MEALLHHSISQGSKAYPNKDAFRFKGDGISYRNLERKTNQLSQVLVEHGVRKGDRVGIFMNKCLELPVAVYGILKAGAAYVPIDPLAPLDRVQFIVENCGINKLLTNPGKRRQIKALLKTSNEIDLVVGVQTDVESMTWEEVFQGNALPVELELFDVDLAYIMYTSGSTGTPKGLMHTHRSGLAYAKYSASTYDVGNEDVLGNHSPLHFDMSTFEFLTGPYCGSTTVLIPEEATMFPVSLGQLIEEEKLTFWYSVPLALIQMINQGQIEERNLDSLRWVMFGGEPFPPKYLRSLMDRMPNARFSNVYGPAEVNQCTYYHVPKGLSADAESIPIGEVWSGAHGKVVDAENEEVNQGETGELLIQSSTMMQAYWKRDDLNEKAFYTSEDFQVYYRTGDLVQFSDSGELLFLGRKDRQIKIRGYRMELDEVENVFNSIDPVEEAAAIAIVNAEGNKEICAAVTVKENQTIEEPELKRFAMAKLPVYGVPKMIQIRQSFPRTTSGKIDRKQLTVEFQGTQVS